MCQRLYLKPLSASVQKKKNGVFIVGGWSLSTKLWTSLKYVKTCKLAFSSTQPHVLNSRQLHVLQGGDTLLAALCSFNSGGKAAACWPCRIVSEFRFSVLLLDHKPQVAPDGWSTGVWLFTGVAFDGQVAPCMVASATSVWVYVWFLACATWHASTDAHNTHWGSSIAVSLFISVMFGKEVFILTVRLYNFSPLFLRTTSCCQMLILCFLALCSLLYLLPTLSFCLHSHCIHQILDSVSYTHQHDIVHRDLKVCVCLCVS